MLILAVILAIFFPVLFHYCSSMNRSKSKSITTTTTTETKDELFCNTKYCEPPTLPILGCLIPFNKNRYRLLDWYTNLLSLSKTNTILIRRLGHAPTIITANPDNLRHILTANFPNYPKGPLFSDILGDFLGRGIFNADGPLWRLQRKIAAHGFSVRSLRDHILRHVQIESHNRLIPVLDHAFVEKKVLDLQDVLYRFAFDTVCIVSFGFDPEWLQPSMPSCKLAQSFDIAGAISAGRATQPFPAIWKLKRALQIGSERQLQENIQIVHKSVMDMIQAAKTATTNSSTSNYDRQNNTTTTPDQDLLSRVLSILHDYDDDQDKGSKEELVRDMVISFLLAGKDTVSSALTWFFWLISCHPEVEKELIDEIDLKLNGRTVEQAVDFECLMTELKFLEACLCESMRLYPPVAWDSKHAENEDVLPDGTFVGKGWRVTYFPYGMGRMENLWGKDCLEFKPHRWTETDYSNKNNDGVRDTGARNRGGVWQAVSVYKFPVFQAGPRQCLGKDMAFLEMKYVAAAMLNRFRIRPATPDFHPRFLPLLTAKMAGGFPVIVEERRPNS